MSGIKYTPGNMVIHTKLDLYGTVVKFCEKTQKPTVTDVQGTWWGNIHEDSYDRNKEYKWDACD